MKTKHLLAAGLIAFLSVPALTAAGPKYFVIDLGSLTLPDGGVAVSAAHVNNFGQVTGYFDIGGSASRGFVYARGSMHDLGTLGGNSSFGLGINDVGQVTGWSDRAAGIPHAFLYSTGTMQDLGVLPPTREYINTESVGFAVNNSGQVTGYSPYDYVDYGSGIHAFLFASGTMKDIGSLNTTTNDAESQGFDINDAGQVTGKSATPGLDAEHAFLYSGGNMRDLGTLPGYSHSYGLGINGAGVVAGYSEDHVSNTYRRHAFLYSGGSMADLGALPGDRYSRANAINNVGQVVGSSDNFISAEHAFLYFGGTMYDLNDLTTNLSSVGFLYLDKANGINDQSWIVGTAQTTGNAVHAFLAIPTTPPVLQIETGDSGLELRWPASANEWTLQTSTTLAAGSWTAVSGPITTDLGSYVYSFPHNEPRRFFRLFNSAITAAP